MDDVISFLFGVFLVAVVAVVLCVSGCSAGYAQGQRDAAEGKWYQVKVNGEWVEVRKPSTRPTVGE